MLNIPQINPLHVTSSYFLDFGDVESPDGRSHPVTALTPAYVAPAASKDCSQYSVGSLAWQRCQAEADVASGIAGSSAPQNGGSGPTPNPVSGSFFSGIAQGTIARLAVGVLAIGVLLVVAVRLTK